MAEAWRDSVGPPVVDWLGTALLQVHPTLDVGAFVSDCLDGLAERELLDRGRHVAGVMARHLPADPTRSIPLVSASLAEPAPPTLDAFRFLPHSAFIAERGLGAPEQSMAAMRELTRRFTAEFAIRPFLRARPDATLARLRTWATDPDEHVRRLVSEGTRPRLPWAARLDQFVADPSPVLDLLELLRDDPSAYVRRSVANNLNDISKDHPDLVRAVARRWLGEGEPTAARRRLVSHALRTLVKRGDLEALSILGMSGADVEVVGSSITPSEPRIGQKVAIEVVVRDTRVSGGPTRVAVDVVVGFVKASGATSARVFKGGVRDLEPGELARVRCTVSVAQHTTRTHYAGLHPVWAQVNGRRQPIGDFQLVGSSGPPGCTGPGDEAAHDVVGGVGERVEREPRQVQ